MSTEFGCAKIFDGCIFHGFLHLFYLRSLNVYKEQICNSTTQSCVLDVWYYPHLNYCCMH